MPYVSMEEETRTDLAGESGVKRLAQDIALIAFGRAAVAIAPYVEAGRPERGGAALLRLGWQMEQLREDVERQFALQPRTWRRRRND